MSSLQAAVEGRYRLEREIGAGGMASVYLAHDLRHDRQVAIKVVHPELAAALGGERFLTEIRTTARLQHPHILPLLDSGAADGVLFYVMPLVTGESLRSRLARERQLPVPDAVRIAREVADALSHAHAHGIVHRDIKPENILLQDGHALVADFGIALAVQHAGGQRITQTGLSLGTPQYMSPEQAMGERTVDHRADLYALGAVTYEMLAGEPPFTGPTVQAILARLIADVPRPVGDLRKSVPAPVEAAVMRALEKLPADRVATAKEFTALLESDSATATRLPVRRQVQAWPRVTAALALATLLSLVLAAWLWSRGHRVEPGPVLRFVVEPLAGQTLSAQGLTGPSVALSPDGSMAAFLATGEDGTRRLLIRRMADTEARVLRGTEGATQPFFSPDGRTVAFWAAGRMQMISTDDGSPRRIADMPEYNGAVWAAPDQIVYSDRSRLFSISPRGGPPVTLAEPDPAKGEVGLEYPTLAQDGEHVLFASWRAGGAELVRLGAMTLSGRNRVLFDIVAVTPLGMIDGEVIGVTSTNDITATPVDLGSGRTTGITRTVGSGVIVGSGGIAKAALSRSGTLVYVTGTRESQIVLVGLDGVVRRTVLGEVRAYGYPRYSPDASLIAITIAAGASRDVWVHDVASGTLTPLSSGAAVNERPEWSPDGARVLYRTDRDSRSSIWWRPVDLSAPPSPLLQDEAGAYFEAVLTPDARTIVYQVDTSGADVYYRSLDGDTTPRVVAASSVREQAMRLSPDGRWIAYTNDEGGAPQVIVQPFPGPGRRLQVSTSGGTEPVWSPDGTRIFYRGNGLMMVAELALGAALSVQSRRVLFEDTYLHAAAPHADYDVTRDGQSLLMLRGQNQQRLVAVHNWSEEVRRGRPDPL